MALRDPNLPAGAIVEVFEDGGALRNDWVRLKPASQNPWYVLATVAGEQNDLLIDKELHARNRRYWNAWMCRYMDDVERALLASILGVQEKTLARIDENELALVRNRFETAYPDQNFETLIPKTGKFVDCKNIYFLKNLHLKGFYFPGVVVFDNSHFSRLAYFDQSVYKSPATFNNVHFAENASFSQAHFDSVIFRGSQFYGSAYFNKVRFCGIAHFEGSYFKGRVTFSLSRFSSYVFFSLCKFDWITEFRNTVFALQSPVFTQTQFHQDTTFTNDPGFWPTANRENSKRGIETYTLLQQFAAENRKTELERFFLRQEWACKEVLSENTIDRWTSKAFGFFADYGNSFAWPAFWLAAVWGSCWGIIGSYLKYCKGYTNPIGDGAMIALGNTLPFINISEKMHQDFYKHAPWWLDLLSALQSILGIILIFFIALGLRNRFRLK
jgi:uncharacterized protein YjbI with pentapeptide repeats